MTRPRGDQKAVHGRIVGPFSPHQHPSCTGSELLPAGQITYYHMNFCFCSCSRQRDILIDCACFRTPRRASSFKLQVRPAVYVSKSALDQAFRDQVVAVVRPLSVFTERVHVLHNMREYADYWFGRLDLASGLHSWSKENAGEGSTKGPKCTATDRPPDARQRISKAVTFL